MQPGVPLAPPGAAADNIRQMSWLALHPEPECAPEATDGPLFGPVPLLFLHHASADHRVNCRLHKGRRDRGAVAIAVPIVDDEQPVRPDVAREFSQRLVQFSSGFALTYQQHHVVFQTVQHGQVPPIGYQATRSTSPAPGVQRSPLRRAALLRLPVLGLSSSSRRENQPVSLARPAPIA